MLHLATILHPTDLSEHSEFAFRLACALARDYKARLILLHVFPEPMVVNVPEVAPGEKWPSAEEVEEHLRQLKDRAHNIRVESRVMVGDPVGMILRAAEETNCDVIVMGTHGRTALTRLLMGSVAEEVLRRAPCPVLTSKLGFGRNRLVEENGATAEATAAATAGSV